MNIDLIILMAAVGVLQLVLILMLSQRLTKIAEVVGVEITFFGGVQNLTGRKLAKELRRELRRELNSPSLTVNPYDSGQAE